jgi:hypothetical protein
MEVEVVDGQDLKKIVDATIDGPRVVPGTVPNPAAGSMGVNASTLSDQVPKATGGPGMVAEQ